MGRKVVHVMIQIGLVSLGSALGGLARWGVGLAFGRLFGTWFPWGTLFINVTGSLFLGWFATIVSDRLENGLTWIGKDNLQLMVAVGFTGAYAYSLACTVLGTAYCTVMLQVPKAVRVLPEQPSAGTE
jgi:hypothetical protein